MSEIEGPYEYDLKLHVGLTAERLVRALGDGAPDDVRTLVMELDEEVGLWALTILLARYFQGQLDIITQENPELVAMTNDELLAQLTEGE